jgi:hypothetical protein
VAGCCARSRPPRKKKASNRAPVKKPRGIFYR